MKARPYDSATVHVFLEHGMTFRFDVQDWEDDPPESCLTDDQAYAMARGLIFDDHAHLYGVFHAGKVLTAPGVYTSMTVDPTRVVAMYVEPTGMKGK